jgi:hypothetical protein
MAFLAVSIVIMGIVALAAVLHIVSILATCGAGRSAAIGKVPFTIGAMVVDGTLFSAFTAVSFQVMLLAANAAAIVDTAGDSVGITASI